MQRIAIPNLLFRAGQTAITGGLIITAYTMIYLHLWKTLIPKLASINSTLLFAIAGSEKAAEAAVHAGNIARTVLATLSLLCTSMLVPLLFMILICGASWLTFSVFRFAWNISLSIDQAKRDLSWIRTRIRR